MKREREKLEFETAPKQALYKMAYPFQSVLLGHQLVDSSHQIGAFC
jgi:hypothetical protein